MATRRTAAIDYIASHFSDPELSLAKVARSLRISPRYLQRVLETAGISFASHVIELRLKQAYMLITAQRRQGSNFRYRLAVWIFRRFLL